MVTYACLGLMFLFVVILSIIYASRRSKAPAPEQIDKLLFSILRSIGRDGP